MKEGFSGLFPNLFFLRISAHPCALCGERFLPTAQERFMTECFPSATPMMRPVPRSPVERRRFHTRALHHVVNIGVAVIETPGAHAVVIVAAAGVTSAGVDLFLQSFHLF